MPPAKEEKEYTIKLSPDQVSTYLNEGILVVPNILTPLQLERTKIGFTNTLKYHKIDPNHLKETGCNLRSLSSTNGSGGVLDIFYPQWKMLNIVTNKCLFDVTRQLWEASLCHNGESEGEMMTINYHKQQTEGKPDANDAEDEEEEEDSYHKWHPFGPFDCRRGYACIDRIGYRLPTTLAEEIGNEIYLTKLQKNNQHNQPQSANRPVKKKYIDNSTSTITTTISKKQRKKLKANSIQRSLTPHLDCCPKMYNSTYDINNQPKKKWRPIQCFVALTTNDTQNTGGFEACSKFHLKFHEWSKTPTSIGATVATISSGDDSIKTMMAPSPCIGEYTHIRPKEDAEIYKRMKHIPVPEGGAVFWDNRIPHANSYVHDGDEPRMVVYASFLPDVECNRMYVEKQLEDWRNWKRPRDMWIEVDDDDDKKKGGKNSSSSNKCIGSDCGNKAKNIEDDEEKTHLKESKSDEEENIKMREEEFTPIGRKIMGIDPW
mmetsp:Transcript_2367/g.3428  ORF Transcript_2367/g.3428 Transcript_2367/m.3428 type:complete len:488 (+) Transcript_2367:99-1562(+)